MGWLFKSLFHALTTTSENSPTLWHSWRFWKSHNTTFRRKNMTTNLKGYSLKLPSEGIEQGDNLLATQLERTAISCVRHCLYLSFWEQDFEGCSQALCLQETFIRSFTNQCVHQITVSSKSLLSYLQFAPKSAFKTFDTVHDAWNVLKGTLKVLLIPW